MPTTLHQLFELLFLLSLPTITLGAARYYVNKQTEMMEYWSQWGKRFVDFHEEYESIYTAYYRDQPEAIACLQATHEIAIQRASIENEPLTRGDQLTLKVLLYKRAIPIALFQGAFFVVLPIMGSALLIALAGLEKAVMVGEIATPLVLLWTSKRKVDKLIQEHTGRPKELDATHDKTKQYLDTFRAETQQGQEHPLLATSKGIW